jgi:hypothetical protein
MQPPGEAASGTIVAGRLAAGSVAGEVLRSVVISAISVVIVLVFAPPPGDASAHLYRTWLVEQDVWWWDNLWFAGSYPLATYSPIYYLLTAVVGSTAIPVIGALASAGCFAALVVREWGRIGVWPARVFGVCSVGPMITGTAPYGLGLAAALGALVLIQRRRFVLGAVAAIATVAFSALAFVFLGLVLTAVAVSRRCATTSLVKVGLGLALAAGAWLASRFAFPEEGQYPFLWWTLLIVVAVSGCMLAITLRTRDARFFSALFALWLLACVVLFVVPSPIGEIVTRLRYVMLPLALLAVGVAGWRPRWLAVFVVAGAFAYNVAPYAASLAVRAAGDENASEEAFWDPVISFLQENASEEHLVEVVATGAHWETYYLPRAGFPVVRGWYRQIDMSRNEVLYDADARGADYERWLHDNAVRYVVLPDIRLDPHTGGHEVALLEAADDLELIMATEDFEVYEVTEPTPLLTGPGDARITDLSHESVEGTVDSAGEFRLRLMWSPHLEVVEGDATVHERDDGQITLSVAEPGRFRLEVRPEPPFLLLASLGL